MNVNLQAIHFRECMAIHQKKIGPSIVIKIEEPAAPADKAGIVSHTGCHCDILKISVALVVIKSFKLIGKIRSENRREPFVKVVACGDTHAGKGLSVIVQGGTTNQRLVHEFAVALIDIEY